MILVPLDLHEANAFVGSYHRHNREARGCKFCLGASHENQLVGVAIAGRPIARSLDDGFTLEVRRCCVIPAAPKGTCSFLYSACWRAWRAMGGRRAMTYTLASESGASLRRAGWRCIGEVPMHDPADWQNRAGREWQAVIGQQKLRWETG